MDVSKEKDNLDREELIKVLCDSLYPGAKRENALMVLSYCKAAGLDPMQKPVHIMQVDVAEKKPNGEIVYVKRDVVMPGIGFYRTQASRSGEYVGMSEPEFGPTKTIPTRVKQWNNAHQNDKTFKMVDGPDISFPEWCLVIVRRTVGGRIAEFPAKEYWLENYATAGRDTTAPNSMWKKRPYGQLAKCTEAQALRKAFPELIGDQPTADEMEGKDILDAVVHGNNTNLQPQSNPPKSQNELLKGMLKTEVKAGKSEAVLFEEAIVSAKTLSELEEVVTSKAPTMTQDEHDHAVAVYEEHRLSIKQKSSDRPTEPIQESLGV